VVFRVEGDRAEATVLYLTDLIVAEPVYVLESVYEAPREQVATAMRSLVSMRSVITVDPALMLRASEVYETVDRLEP
jgi:predicted nucleic-acid-binding protein